MNMRLIIALLTLAFRIGPDAEEQTFYQKDTDNWWTVYGGANTETGQATCYGRANKKDGSFIQIHRSLVDGEVWAFVHDTEWEIQGPERGSLRWNFFNGLKNGLIAGANFELHAQGQEHDFDPANRAQEILRGTMECPVLHSGDARKRAQSVAQF